MFGLTSFLTFAAAVTPLLALDTQHGAPVHRRHHEVAHRARGDIGKRFGGARATFYATGMGACGKVNAPGDFIVALNQEQFGYSYPSKYCFQTITISYGGKSTQAQIVDSCPGCPFAGLDMSEGLFSYFASTDMGVIAVTWNFGSGGGDDDPPKPTTSKYVEPPKPTPTPTTHYQAPEPTTTWTPPTTTKPKPTPTTHSTEQEPTTTSTPKSSPTTHSTSSTPSTSAIPTPTPSLTPSVSASVSVPAPSASTVPSTGPDNLQALNSLVINYGALLGAAAAQ